MYKLKMMNIPVNEPAFVYGDNMSVIHNTTSLESALKNKSTSSVKELQETNK